jgi:hypothetical protein
MAELLNLERIIGIYDQTMTDWLASTRLVSLLNNDPGGDVTTAITLADLARFAKHHDQSFVTREFDGNKATRGYSKKQWVDSLNNLRQQAQADFDARQEHTLEACAERVLSWITGLDPDWYELVEALQEERNFDAKATLASLTAYVLDNRLHMVVPQHEALQGVQWTREPQECSICHEMYQMEYPGQPCCLKPECGRAFHAFHAEAPV